MGEDRDQRIRDWLVSKRADQFALLAELVREPSVNPPGECAVHAECTHDLLKGLGFEVELHPVANEVAEPLGRSGVVNLVARRCFGDGPVVALSAPADTAPAGEGWSRDPFDPAVGKGRMSGLGVGGSKSDLAAYAFAVAALDSAAPELQGTVELHVTYDGETGGELGAKWLLDNGVSKPDFALCGGSTYEIATSAKGCLGIEVEIVGREASAARPELGHDALEALTRVLAALYGLRDEYDGVFSETPGIGRPTLVVTQVQGGDRRSTVPGRAQLRLDRRILPEEDPAAVERELTDLIGTTVVKIPNVMCRVRRVRLIEAMKPGADAGALAEALKRRGTEVIGETPTVRGTAAETIGSWYAAAGAATALYGAGPVADAEEAGGDPDESLDLDDLRKSTEVVALAVADLLGSDQSSSSASRTP